MEIGNYGFKDLNQQTYEKDALSKYSNSNVDDNTELSLEEEINKSAVEVSLSTGAQLILLMMDATETTNENSSGQKDILDFLAGKEVSEEFNLENIGYEGKPITELSKDEAAELLGDDGFFGIEQTSNRVANFVLGFSGDDIDKLEAGREGIVKGFEEAQEMWGGELPQISQDTQTRTLALIDAKIAELKENEE